MLTQAQQEFLDAAVKIAKMINLDTGLLVSGQVAQACVESAWGSKCPGNNYFGIKAHSCPFVAGSIVFNTHEDVGGQLHPENDAFAKYDSMEKSFRCHDLLLKNHYPTAHDAKTPETYIQALENDPVTHLKYATDQNYVKLFLSVVNSHNLKQFDSV